MSSKNKVPVQTYQSVVETVIPPLQEAIKSLKAAGKSGDYALLQQAWGKIANAREILNVRMYEIAERER
jgi:hypothetical protein